MVKIATLATTSLLFISCACKTPEPIIKEVNRLVEVKVPVKCNIDIPDWPEPEIDFFVSSENLIIFTHKIYNRLLICTGKSVLNKP